MFQTYEYCERYDKFDLCTYRTRFGTIELQTPQEEWQSGRMRILGKDVCGQPYRGFESHLLRYAYI